MTEDFHIFLNLEMLQMSVILIIYAENKQNLTAGTLNTLKNSSSSAALFRPCKFPAHYCCLLHPSLLCWSGLFHKLTLIQRRLDVCRSLPSDNQDLCRFLWFCHWSQTASSSSDLPLLRLCQLLLSRTVLCEFLWEETFHSSQWWQLTFWPSWADICWVSDGAKCLCLRSSWLPRSPIWRRLLVLCTFHRKVRADHLWHIDKNTNNGIEIYIERDIYRG